MLIFPVLLRPAQAIAFVRFSVLKIVFLFAHSYLSAWCNEQVLLLRRSCGVGVLTGVFGLALSAGELGILGPLVLRTGRHWVDSGNLFHLFLSVLSLDLLSVSSYLFLGFGLSELFRSLLLDFISQEFILTFVSVGTAA